MLAFAVSACGGSGKITTSGPPQSGSSERGGDAGGAITIPGTDQTIPGLDDLPELPDIADIPGAGNLADCTEIGTLYATISLGAVGSSAEDAAKVADATAQLRERLPEDLRDDIDIVAAAFAKVNESIIEAGQAMSEPEFETANKNLTDYVTEVCTGG